MMIPKQTKLGLFFALHTLQWWKVTMHLVKMIKIHEKAAFILMQNYIFSSCNVIRYPRNHKVLSIVLERHSELHGHLLRDGKA